MKLISRKQITKLLYLLIIIIHVAGLFGLANTGTREWFASFTPINLLLLGLGFFLSAPRVFDYRFIVFTVILVLAGYAVEFIGVQTGYVFGQYSYGRVLGPKFFGTPLIIGVNWFILVLSSYEIAKQLKLSPFITALLAAIFMTMFDFILEPVAVKLSFWHWHNGQIPFQNYVAWFVFSLLFTLFRSSFQFNIDKRYAMLLFVVQLAFFISLNFIL